VEKEIYALTRLAEADDDEAATKGALRFDLTVPLARYVAMRERELAFPFRRYQIQRVWRGETPQARKGRWREFYQCDIDVIGREKLSYLAEAEIPAVIYSVFREMAIGEFRIRINNRKVLKGILRQFEVPEAKSAAVLRILDKAEKEDAGRLKEELRREGASQELFDLIAARRDTQATLSALRGMKHCEAGLGELARIADAIRQFGVPEAAFAVDLGIVRGLDYYTGTIYETTLTDAPEIGSICSGGRYDDLASYFTDTRLPGVGISIGLTRLFSRLKEANLLRPLPRTPAEVLVTTMDPQRMDRYLRIAASLRAAGINTEVYLETAKLGNQLTYADRKGFRLAVIAGENEFAKDVVQLKNLGTKTARDVASGELVAAVQSTLKS
jgi:histidyl-tRNA synthetase